MKTIRIIIAATCVYVCLSCGNELIGNRQVNIGTEYPVIEVDCDIEEPIVGEATSTKVYGYIADPGNYPGRHTVKWKAGDQISMFSVVSSDNAAAAKGEILNFSNLRSTLRWGDGTRTFSMNVPNLTEIYGASSGVTSHLCAIYPATTLNVTLDNISGNIMDVSAVPHSSTPLTIPINQDGTGWKYSIFLARSSTFSAAYNSPDAGGGITFHLMSTLLRVRVKTTKDIMKVVLSTTADVLAGDVSSIKMDDFHDASGVGDKFFLASGCDEQNIIIDNGDILPEDLYFAIMELREDSAYTMTFTATDGSTITRSFTTLSGESNRKMKGVFSLGEIDLVDWSNIEPSESASEAAINMGVGMNLSCMEASWETIRDERDNPTYYETASGQGITTAQTMQSIADAGYGCVRIPVTWHLHMDDLQSEIDKVWLDRIEEIVDYALDAGLYAIINLHHDAGNRFGRWCIADVSHYESASAGLKNIWSQIATRFRDKDYRLLFEGYNEILDGSDTWTYPKDPSSIAVANQLHQDFVNAVRRTGGKNSTRNLILNTYGATATERAVSEFRMPDDVTSGHLMVQFHSYVPTDFTSQLTQGRDNLIESDYAEMEAMFAPVKRYIVDKGYPCIMGEFGSYPREGRSEDDRATHAGYMTRLALERGIVPIIWYSPMSGSDRTTGRWTNPKVRDAMIGAYNEHIGK